MCVDISYQSICKLSLGLTTKVLYYTDCIVVRKFLG